MSTLRADQPAAELAPVHTTAHHSSPSPQRGRRPRRRYHLTWPTGLFVALTLFAGLGANVSQYSILFLIFAALLTAIVFSGVVSGAMLMVVDARRAPTPIGRAGEPLRLTYTVANRSRWLPALAVTVQEAAPADRTGAPRRGRALGPPAWTDLLAPPVGFAAIIPPRGSVTVLAETRPRRRGHAPLHAVSLGSGFPFGIFRKSVTFDAPAAIDVAPRTRPLTADVRRAIASAGDARHAAARRAGTGDEFFGLREYVRGDPPRRVAWRASARTGQLLVRVNSHDVTDEHTLLLLLDPDDHHASEAAIELAASVAEDTLARGGRVGLRAPGHDVDIAPGSGWRHRTALTLALARLDVGLARPAAGAARPNRREAAVVVPATHAARDAAALPPDAAVLEPPERPLP